MNDSKEAPKAVNKLLYIGLCVIILMIAGVSVVLYTMFDRTSTQSAMDAIQELSTAQAKNVEAQTELIASHVKDLAKKYYESARVVIEDQLKEQPDDTRLFSALGLVLAGLGKKDEAIKEGKRATELLPITKEAWRGWHRELDLAKIYTMVGEYDLAIDKLEYLLSIPLLPLNLRM